MSTTNPLTDYLFAIPFDRITAADVQPAIEALLERSRKRLSELKQVSGERNYDNTLGLLDEVTTELEYAMSVVGHLEAVDTSDALRETYNAVQPLVSAFYASIPLDAELWDVLRSFASSEQGAGLTGPRARHLTQTVDEFRRHGAELDAAGKQRLQEISVELSRLTTRYSQQLLDATNAFELICQTEEELAGLPTSARDAARENAASRGLEQGFRFTLQAPSYIAVMTYADDPKIREQMYRAYNTRATNDATDNRPLIARILELRKEKSKLLSYANFADLVLEDRMAGSGHKAQAFLQRLDRATRNFFERENLELEDFRKELEGPAALPLCPWDLAYYAEKLRQARFDFDEEALRPYFGVEGVLQGMFELVGQIYGVTVETREDVPLYHPSVRYFTLKDAEGHPLGSFYADLFPRESKRGGAWMGDFITGMANSPHASHLGVMCANFTPPVGDAPALLTHREVETLFHEFGHLLHHLLGRSTVRSLAGTRVAWDFVELPSMIMENFCWEPEGLALFARHHETGAPIPPTLLERLRKTRTFRAANAQMRQLSFGVTDLALHIDYDPDRNGDAMAYGRAIAQRYSSAELTEDHASLAGFGHLFSSPVGYAAGYYSYKWAEVLEADAFSRFKQDGVLSASVGAEFRTQLLSRGNEREPMELYKAFMGREPDEQALLQRAGLR